MMRRKEKFEEVCHRLLEGQRVGKVPKYVNNMLYACAGLSAEEIAEEMRRTGQEVSVEKRGKSIDIAVLNY